MKGKNWVVSLVVLAVVLPYTEVLLVNDRAPSASNFEVEIETIVSNDEKPCSSEGGAIKCPS